MSEFTRPVRGAMIDYLLGVADWRRRKADEYDRDPRNLRSAEAIEELARYIKGLPDSDRRLTRLHQLSMQGESFFPGQQASYEIGRFRFFDEAGEVDAFLTAVVELAERDAGEQGRFGGNLPPGDDPWE